METDTACFAGKAFARIIIDISHEKVDRPFCYRIPKHLQGKVMVGACVEIPFGKGNTLRKGYVTELLETPDYAPEKLKDIAALVEGVFVENKLILLAEWMKEQYGSTMITALQTVLPVKQKTTEKEKKTIVTALTTAELGERLALYEKKHQTAKVRVLKALLQGGELPYELVTGKLNVSAATLKRLQEENIISIEAKRAYRNPVQIQAKEDVRKTLSAEQAHIVEAFSKDYEDKSYQTYLIHGITGSGKTEVYMELIERVVAEGRAVIVLIPEIALTFQTVQRFQRRFGNRVSILNSSLSKGEKYDQCERAKRGEIDIIIGPRSALFTPFQDVGLIVIDEEHEGTYKSETMPKYHAVEVAGELAKLHGASVVLGSATPSMESYYKAKTGQYRLFHLTKRLTGGTLPKVYVEDLREELKKGNRSIFSDRLRELILERLEKKEQIMLFLNRRGYAGFLSCRACGHVMKCPHCAVSLSQHRNGRMVCHYCGYEEPVPRLCPECGSKYMLGFKAGTEKIEEQFLKEFGPVSILRMDGDTTKNKDSYEKILSAFSEEKAQVLIGTQMIVKGHDFPSVTLVGILAADLSLGANDYRAGERTFQLLTQAAGRAGRGEKPGEVVIQTYQPEHYSILRAAKQDYEGFYEEELLYRELAEYPPVSGLLMIQIFEKEEQEGMEFAKALRENIEAEAAKRGVALIGPANASLSRVNDIYRFSLLLKHRDKNTLIFMKDSVEKWLKTCEKREKIVQFDFNPMNAF